MARHEQRRISGLIQAQAFVDVRYLPLGEYLQPTAYKKAFRGMLTGAPLFWNVERAG